MTQSSPEIEPISDFKQRVYHLTRQIPPGRVATYGQLAFLAGHPGAARAVGSFLRDSQPSDELPWQRVINAQGAISFKGDLPRATLQRALLEAEGVKFTPGGRCDLDALEWEPEHPYWARDWVNPDDELGADEH